MRVRRCRRAGFISSNQLRGSKAGTPSTPRISACGSGRWRCLPRVAQRAEMIAPKRRLIGQHDQGALALGIEGADAGAQRCGHTGFGVDDAQSAYAEAVERAPMRVRIVPEHDERSRADALASTLRATRRNSGSPSMLSSCLARPSRARRAGGEDDSAVAWLHRLGSSCATQSRVARRLAHRDFSRARASCVR